MLYNMERPGNNDIKWPKVFVKKKIPLENFIFLLTKIDFNTLYPDYGFPPLNPIRIHTQKDTLYLYFCEILSRYKQTSMEWRYRYFHLGQEVGLIIYSWLKSSL